MEKQLIDDELVDYLMSQCEKNKKGESVLDIDLLAKILARERGFDEDRVKKIIYALGTKEK